MAEEKEEAMMVRWCSGGAGKGSVDVNPKPYKGLTSKLIDWLERVIIKLMYDSHPSNPHHFLSANFAPLPCETPPTAYLPVTGHLPVC